MSAYNNVDPFLCTCGPCTRFWKINYGKYAPDQLEMEPICRTKNTATLLGHKDLVKIGDQVIVAGKYPGTVKFVGSLDENLIAPEVYVGVYLYDNIGSVHNGIYDGKRYFHCPRGHGAFVPYNQIWSRSPPQKPPIYGNTMFKGYEDIKRRRKLRREKDPDFDVGLTREERIIRCSSASSTNSHSRLIIRSGDPLDVGYQDQIKRQQRLMKRRPSQQAARINTEQNRIAQRERKLDKWKRDFGGGDRGEKMAQTLEKLHLALKKGKELQNESSTESDSDY